MAEHDNFESSQWLQELVQAELRPELDQLFGFQGGFDAARAVEESTAELLQSLKQKFSQICRQFNAFSESGQKYPEVRLYPVANAPNDFMLYRNRTKLVLANTAPGRVTAWFGSHTPTGVSVHGLSVGSHGSAASKQDAGGETRFELTARIGAFGTVIWEASGERLDEEQFTRFIAEEFIRTSRHWQAAKPTQQSDLLQEIRSLLAQRAK